MSKPKKPHDDSTWQGQVLDTLEDIRIAVETGGGTAASSSWRLGTCSGCEHWNAVTLTVGLCQRFPPLAAAVLPTGGGTTVYPPTTDTQSCSEWRAKEI